MHSMSWIAPTASLLEILLLLYVAMIDIATRLIRNEICLVLALLGIAGQFGSQMHVTESLIAATILLLLLIVIYQRRWIGGGDVKLLVALAIGLPLTGVIELLTMTALAGGVLALVHLMMRLLPYPKLAPAGSSFVRRVCDRALAQFATRTATLRGCHSLRWYLDCFQPRTLTCHLLCVSRSSRCCCSQPLRSGLLPTTFTCPNR